jgi:hypothetical protein
MQRKRSIIFDLTVDILVPLLERKHYKEATVASRMKLDKSVFVYCANQMHNIKYM